jgi:hypothetical protein
MHGQNHIKSKRIHVHLIKDKLFSEIKLEEFFALTRLIDSVEDKI